jgi:hypothetical protein
VPDDRWRKLVAGNEIVMRYFTRQTDARYRSRDNTLRCHAADLSMGISAD